MKSFRIIVIILLLLQVGFFVVASVSIKRTLVSIHQALIEKGNVTAIYNLHINTPSVQIDGMWEQMTASLK